MKFRNTLVDAQGLGAERGPEMNNPERVDVGIQTEAMNGQAQEIGME